MNDQPQSGPLSDILNHWPTDAAVARQLQRELAPKLILHDDFGHIDRVAGLDVGFEDGGRTTRAAVVVLRLEDLSLIERSLVRQPTRFPYIPGLLSYREAPALLAALERLQHTPQLLVCDGQGIAHPRRFGIACHLGLITGIPALGVAKKRLCGRYEMPGTRKGDWSPLIHRDETVGAVVRSRSDVSPIFVSPGHRIGLTTAIELSLRLCPKYRLPETTRQAHHLASVEGRK